MLNSKFNGGLTVKLNQYKVTVFLNYDNMKKNQMSIAFNKKQKRLLEKESNRLGSSIASIVRLAITDYFQKQEGKHAK